MPSWLSCEDCPTVPSDNVEHVWFKPTAKGVTVPLGVWLVNLKSRLAGIDANLDDLQAGVEACARAAGSLHPDAAKFDKILKRIKSVPFVGSLLERASELEVFARDQEGTLQELREHIDRLREGLRRKNTGLTAPRLATAADRRQR